MARPPASWLLLRGLAREQRHWEGFPDLLSRELGGAAVHCLDLPGAGTEHRRSCPTDIRGIVADVRQRFEPLQSTVDGPWGLLGISLGGMVAMQWCADFPTDFAHVVLANTSAANLSAPWRRMRLSVAPRLVRAAFDPLPASRELRVLRMTTRLRGDLPALAERWAAYAAERPIGRQTLVRQLMAATRFRAPDRLSMPVLVLSGGHDPFTDPACPRRLAQHFGAPLEVNAEAGHDLSTDAPDWLAGRIREWVRGKER